jgi:hypothetical protein
MISSLEKKRYPLRKRLRALSFLPLMRGTIVERKRRCGRSNCSCAKDPKQRHKGKFLTLSLKGKTRTLHLRFQDEENVQKAIGTYEALWEVVDEMTACELADLRRRSLERRRGRRRRS